MRPARSPLPGGVREAPAQIKSLPSRGSGLLASASGRITSGSGRITVRCDPLAYRFGHSADTCTRDGGTNTASPFGRVVKNHNRGARHLPMTRLVAHLEISPGPPSAESRPTSKKMRKPLLRNRNLHGDPVSVRGRSAAFGAPLGLARGGSKRLCWRSALGGATLPWYPRILPAIEPSLHDAVTTLADRLESRTGLRALGSLSKVR